MNCETAKTVRRALIFLTNVVARLLYWPVRLIVWLVGWVGKSLWLVVGPPLSWLGKRLWPWVRVPLGWLGLALVVMFDALAGLPRLTLWIPYSYVVVGVAALGAIPILDPLFGLDFDPRTYYWWSAVWVPLAAAGIAVALAAVRFVAVLLIRRVSGFGVTAIESLRLVALIWGLPGALWARLLALIIHFWINRFFLAVAIANGLTAVALFVVALTTGEETNWTFIFIAMIFVVASMTGGYSWANQYGSGFVGASGILLAIIIFLWGVWVWLFVLAASILAIAVPFVLPWLFGYLSTPGSDVPMFEPFWINVVVIVLLTGAFAIAPWLLTLRGSSVAELVKDDVASV